MRSVFNCHLDAIDYIARATECPGSQALRCAQLYGFLEHKDSLGESSVFNQATYAKKLHISRDTLRTDLQLLCKYGWLTVLPNGHKGTDVEVHGLPFKDEVPTNQSPKTNLSSDEPVVEGTTKESADYDEPVVEGTTKESSIYKNSSKNSSKKTTNNKTLSNPPIQSDQREQIMQLWNENKHSKWKSLYVLGLRDITVEHISSRIGGIDKFIEYLPLVLQAAAKDKYWGKPGIGWNQFMGTGKTGKANFESFVDVALANQDTKQNSGKFEKEWRVRRDIVNGEIRCIKPNMTEQEIAEATQNLDRQNENPIEPKSKP